MKQSHTTVLERNTEWSGRFETEPYEVGWASEAIFFARVCSPSKAIISTPMPKSKYHRTVCTGQTNGALCRWMATVAPRIAGYHISATGCAWLAKCRRESRSRYWSIWC